MKKFSPLTVLFLIAFVMCTITPTGASAKNTLSWNTFLLAGYYNGAAGEKGIADKILDYYIQHLPEYQHDILEKPIVRLFQTMTEVTDGGYLGPGKTKLPPEQLENVLSSTIHLIMPPAGIAVRKKDLNTIFSGGSNVSVQHLLNQNDKTLVCCWIRGATVHPKIRGAVEEYIRHNESHPNVYFQSQIRENSLQMLMLGRVDYYPIHAIPFQYTCSKLKGCSDNLTFITVNETQDDVVTYTFAAKTKTGRQVISKINRIHNSEEYKKFLKELIQEYFPADLIDIYIKKNMEFVGKEMR